MPELFNQTLLLVKPNSTDRVALGQPSVAGAFNAYWSNLEQWFSDYNVVPISTSLDMSGTGVQSGKLFEASIPDSTEIVRTIPNWTSGLEGNNSKWFKLSGVNSTLRVKSVDGSFDEIIIEDNTSFEITHGTTGYIITQNSRASISDNAVNFFPTATPSDIEPTYGKFVTKESDPDYPAVGVAVPSPIIDSDSTEVSIGFFIDDSLSLAGTIQSRAINTYTQVRAAAVYNRFVKIRFDFYEYVVATNTLNPTPLSSTAYSATITSTEFSQFYIGGTLPTNDWTGKVLVVQAWGIKTTSGANNPIIEFLAGGTTPSKTVLDLPVTNISHDSLAGVSDANIGIQKGHINENLLNGWISKIATVLSANQFTVDTTNLLEGQALKFKILGVYYYGIIDTVGAGNITISGNKSLSGTIEEFYFAINKVNTITYVIADSTTENVAASIQRLLGNVPVKYESGHIVKLETYCHSGTLLKLKVMNGANHIYSTDANGLLCVAQAFTGSGVGLNYLYTLFNSSQELDIDIVTIGSDIENAVVHISQIIGL